MKATRIGKLASLCGVCCCIGSQALAQVVWNPTTGIYQLTTPDYQVHIDEVGFKFEFSGFGDAAIPAHSSHGLDFGGSPIQSILSVTSVDGNDQFRVQAANGELGTVTVHAQSSAVRFNISPDNPATITTQTGGLDGAPAYGLADAAATRSSSNLAGGSYDAMVNDGNVNRFASSFMIHPSRRFAGVSFYPSDTTITTNSDRYSITSQNTAGAGDFKDVDVYYFLGDTADIYAAYRTARVEQGYAPTAPKARMFEIGYESWDELRWNANGANVQNSVQKYLDEGIPIKWAVTGSGFWEDDHTTTSFGFLDEGPTEYPDPTGPNGFGTWTEQNDIAWLIGQRTSFIRDTDNSPGPANSDKQGYVRGPFTDEAENLGYFVNNLDGTRYVSDDSWYPSTAAYVLDGSKQEAAVWFQQKFELWKSLGIDGVKEDTGASGATAAKLKRTDVFNKPLEALANTGSYVMNRNGAFTLPGSLHRINDTGLDNQMGRTPITFLQYAASGAPNGYADSVGIFRVDDNSVRDGVIRNAWFQSLTGGISFSVSPFDSGWAESEQDAIRQVVYFRHALTPYIHSAAVDSYETGFPHTMTPLYIAYPDDPNTYDLANTSDRQYEWMVGPSLLATPLLTNINGSSDQMDIYLPEGNWIDYHTGIEYEGGQTLTDFVMANDRPPAFVGGKGILVERSLEESTLTGSIYPVSPTGTQYTFTHMDGVSETTILNDATAWSPGQMRVTDLLADQTIPFAIHPVTGAIEFEILAGRDYQLTNASSLRLLVDRQTGEMTVLNDSGEQIELDGYTISSPSGALSATDGSWLSLEDQQIEDWRESNADSFRLNELKESGATALGDGTSFSLGAGFAGNPTYLGDSSDEDLVFQYVDLSGESIAGFVEFTGERVENTLTLTVDPSTGMAVLANPAPFDVSIDAYTLVSDSGALDADGWQSLDDQNTAGGNWQEANPGSNRLTETKESGSLVLSPGDSYDLGFLYDAQIGGELMFQFLLEGDITATDGMVLFAVLAIPGDYNDDGVVNLADYVVWRNHLGAPSGTLPNDVDGGTVGAAQYLTWKNSFRNATLSTASSAGSTHVPEPTTSAFFLLAVFLLYATPKQSGIASKL